MNEPMKITDEMKGRKEKKISEQLEFKELKEKCTKIIELSNAQT